ncbi:phage tail protein, partial [Salmonella enterica]|nr:phage tail protein [Salmonella enterica subsp. enterica serovar Montevideo]
MINLILSAPVPEMAEAFKRVFANADNVNIVGQPF